MLSVAIRSKNKLDVKSLPYLPINLLFVKHVIHLKLEPRWVIILAGRSNWS
jgi:hypothetical protein